MCANNNATDRLSGQYLGCSNLTTLATVLVVLATPSFTRATLVHLKIDPIQSSLGITMDAYDSSSPNTVLRLDDISATDSYGQPSPSNYGIATGDIYMNWTPGTSIQFLTTSHIDYEFRYSFYPYRDSSGSIVAPPGGIPSSGQIGFEQYLSTDGGATFSPGNGYANIYGLSQNFGTDSTKTIDGGAALPLAAGIDYSASDLALIPTSGTMDLFGAVTDSYDLTSFGSTGMPLLTPVTGHIVTFDGTTLVIPVEAIFQFMDGTTNYSVTTYGVTANSIVATVVPEPSTLALAALGVLAVTACGLRRRKR